MARKAKAHREQFRFYKLNVRFANAVILDIDKLVDVAVKAIPGIIRKRVKKDLDAHDQPMQLLSPRTVERLRLENKPEDPILRGPMIDNLEAFRVQKFDAGATLSFRASGADQRGKPWAVVGAFHQIGLGVPRRWWFGLSKKDRRTLTRMLKKAGALVKTTYKKARRRP